MSAPFNREQRLSSSVTTAFVALLLCVHYWLGLSALEHKSVTSDETIHLASGYSYWRFDDYRMQPENGNLPQRWSALPLLLLRPHLVPAEYPVLWSNSHSWYIADRFFFHSGNNSDFMLFCGRAIMGAWSVATGLLVFLWARALWGERAGLFSLALFAVSPTTLAHGFLVTSDMCASLWLAAATAAWWRLCSAITWKNLGWSLGATSLAFVAKFSCILLFPIFGLLLLVRVAMPAPVIIGFSSRHPSVSARGKKLACLSALGIGEMVFVTAVVWSFYGWRFTAFAPGLPPPWKFYFTWDLLLQDAGIFRAPIRLALKAHLLPEGYIYGFAQVLYQSSARGAFLLGQYRNTGWWWFFPYTFLAKSTLGELLLTLGVVASAATRWWRAKHQPIWPRVRSDLVKTAPLLALALVYGLLSLTSKLNIGHRHILPLYPLLFVLAGCLVRPAAAGWSRVLAGTALLVGVVETVQIRPDYLTFFNRAVGGPAAGWRQLVDSSLDWGQELPAVSDWVRLHRQPGEPLFVSYFGTGDPAYEGLAGHELSPIYFPGQTRPWFELEAGLYCISATMLQEVYSRFHGPWTAGRQDAYFPLLQQMRAEIAAGARSRIIPGTSGGVVDPLDALDRLRFSRLAMYLRIRRPEAIVGYSVFIYRLDAEEIRIVNQGSPQELATLMSRAER